MYTEDADAVQEQRADERQRAPRGKYTRASLESKKLLISHYEEGKMANLSSWNVFKNNVFVKDRLSAKQHVVHRWI